MAVGAKPTVLVLNDYGGSFGGSAVSMVTALARGCAARGWDLESCYTSVAAGRPWLDDLAAVGVPTAIAPDGRAAKARWLGKKLDRIAGPVVLHTHFAAFDLAAIAAARKRPDVKVIWHVHSFLRREPTHALRALIKYGWLGRGVDRIVCVSEAAARSVGARGARRSQILVIPNGVDVDEFPVVDEVRRREARASVGVPGGHPVLLHFGWDWEVKGGDLFAAGLAEVRGRGIDALGIVVGGGDAARDAAGRFGLGEALLAVAPSEDVVRFFAAADVLVASSPAEGGGPPMAVIEALSSGVPVVATDIPGHRVAGGGPAALELVAADAAAIADAVSAALSVGGPEAAARAAESHEWVKRERGVEQWVTRMTDVYADLLES